MFEIENTTPILMGGYSKNTVARMGVNHVSIEIKEELRPSAIKGVWRWWARALNAAAYHRRFGSHLDIRQADELISSIFGTTSFPSSLAIWTENPEHLRYIEIREIVKQLVRKLYNNQEVKRLLVFWLIGGKTAIDARSRFKLHIKTDLEGKILNFAMYSLYLSLTLEGVGRMTSRGFGKFRVLKISGWNGIEDPPSISEEKILGLIKKGIESANELLREVKEAHREQMMEIADPDGYLEIEFIRCHEFN